MLTDSTPLVAIGNARLYGLEEDLGLVGDQFQIAVSVLFITYCVSKPCHHATMPRISPVAPEKHYM